MSTGIYWALVLIVAVPVMATLYWYAPGFLTLLFLLAYAMAAVVVNVARMRGSARTTPTDDKQ